LVHRVLAREPRERIAARVRAILGIVWAPVAVVAAHSILTATTGHHTKLDPLFHFLGGAAGAYSVDGMARAYARVAVSTAVRRAALMVGAVIVAALLWELAEFISDWRFGTHIQESRVDTISDVALGTLGALVVARMVARRTRKPR
jgi:hypothetical protein